MYAGNASILNFMMRWPVLIPVVAVVTGVTVVTKIDDTIHAAPPPLQPAVIEIPKVETPRALRKLEELCPPVAETSKLKKADKDALRKRGCKVAG